MTLVYCISPDCIAIVLYSDDICVICVCINTWDILRLPGRLWSTNVNDGRLRMGFKMFQGCTVPATILGAAGLWPDQGCGASRPWRMR